MYKARSVAEGLIGIGNRLVYDEYKKDIINFLNKADSLRKKSENFWNQEYEE